MNIFFLSLNPRKCARYHVDRHCVKMILEYAQLLCTAIWLTRRSELLNNPDPPYKATHPNHPCAIWTRKSKENWLWLRSLALALCQEYTYRYDKRHKTQDVIESLQIPNLPDLSFSPPPQAMPDEYKVNPNNTTFEDTIDAYRNYYILGKAHLHAWKNRHAWKRREIPSFIRKGVSL